METLETLLVDYGYVILFIGTFLEGETILLVAGYMVSLGYFSLNPVIGVAFLGTFLGDQIYYFVGRHWGQKLVQRWENKWRRRIDKVLILLARYDAWFILSFRFFYGVRTVSPFAIGMSRVAPGRFFILNALAALVWAISFGYLGFFFGKAIEQYMGRAKDVQLYILGGIVLIGLLVWGINQIRYKPK